MIIGNAPFITNHLKPNSFECFSDSMKLLAQAEKTSIHGIKGQIKGIIGIAYPIRPESQEGFQQLRQARLEVSVLTGDHHQVTEAIASDLGLTHFLAETFQAQKSVEIKTFNTMEKKQVAMLGNSIIMPPPSLKQMSELQLEQEPIWRRRPLRIP